MAIRTQAIQTNFTAGEISPKLEGRVDIAKYFNAAKTVENFMIMPYGGIVRRPGTYFVSEVKYSAKQTRLIPFQFSTTQAYMLEFGDQYIRFYKDQGQITSLGVAYEIATPYLEADLFEIEVAQSADVLYIAHQNYAPRKLSRTWHTSWTLNLVDFVDGPYMEDNITNVTLQASSTVGSVTITAVAPTWATNTFYHVNDQVTQSAVVYKCLEAHTSGTFLTDQTAEKWTASPLAVFQSGHVGAFFRKIAGYFEITGYTSGSVVTAMVRGTITTAATTDWAEGAFSSVRGYPAAVTFYEQRLFWAGSTEQPQTIWGSKIGSFEDHGVSDPLVNDDAISYTLYSEQVNAIQWLMPGRTLFIGTSGGYFTLDSGSVAEPLTPTNVIVRRENTFGCDRIMPEKVGNYVYYVQRNARKIREIGYEFQSDSWKAGDMTILAEQITESGIVDMDYQISPQSVLWCVRDDGEISCLTREIDQEVMGWSRIITEGSFESVGIIPGTNEDEVWVIVNRTVGETTKRYVEYFKPMDWGADQEDCFFVDSGLSYDGTPVSSVSGLDHLEGETVSILADAAVHPDQVVASGTVTLTTPASVIHVGLPYTSTLLTCRPELGDNKQTSQGRKKRISKTWVRLFESVGCRVGSEDTQDIIPFRDSSMDMDEAIPLYTGDKEVQFPEGYSDDARVCVIQEQPLPLHVLAIIVHISVFDG